MSRMRAAIRASAKARKTNTVRGPLKCWGGLGNTECDNHCGDLVDAEGYRACAAHGGKLYVADGK